MHKFKNIMKRKPDNPVFWLCSELWTKPYICFEIKISWQMNGDTYANVNLENLQGKL